MGIFDGFPVPPDKAYLREELTRIDETWAAARFDSLPHVVHILTSKDREVEVQLLKEQSDIVEDVVDEVVHSYHGGFNRAIQNYSQILRLFSESTESICGLKIDLAEAKKSLGARNKQLHQLWYRSVTLRHIISLLDQIEGIAKVPSRIEKLISEKQFYAAVQLHVQSMLMLEREGLQSVGALQDVRSELTKLRGTLFYKVLEDLHAHLYNKGEYSSAVASLLEQDDEVPTTTAAAFSMNNSQRLSRRTRTMKGDNQVAGQGLLEGSLKAGSFEGGSVNDGYDDDASESHEERINGGDSHLKEIKKKSSQLPAWLLNSTPDEFIETIKKSDAPLHVKYLQTMVECLCMLGKVAAAGAIICQRLRPTVHEIITSKIKSHSELANPSRSGIGSAAQAGHAKGVLESYQFSKQKRQNVTLPAGAVLAVSPVSSVMAPTGRAQAAARELLDLILGTLVRIFENHIIIGDLLEMKSAQQLDMNTPTSVAPDANWNSDPEASQDTGGYSVGFSLTVFQSECQQLICEILRSTPEAAAADAAVKTARHASKVPSKEKREGSEDGLTFAFRFTDASLSVPNQGTDIMRQGWSRRGPNVSQEGYGTGALLPEQGIYLVASLYRPVVQFTDKIASMLHTKYSQLGKEGLLSFVEKFVKDHFLPTMFVDYRKGVQQAISSPAAFRPRAHAITTYCQTIEKGRPILQGLLAIDFLAKEVLGWAQAMPKFAGELVKYMQTFLERTYERCRTSYMEAVLEKQSYMLIGRHDIDRLMRLDPASACLPYSHDTISSENPPSYMEAAEVESQLSDMLWNLQPIKQENLIRDDSKMILLASLSDSLEYVADSIERLGQMTLSNQVEDSDVNTKHTNSKDLGSFADDYRKLAVDCLKVLRIEMQLETVLHMQEMVNREYLDDEDAEEPDDFIISLSAKIARRDEEMVPFVAEVKRNYIFGGICSLAAYISVKALAKMKSINLFGVQQICRNSIALEQALAAVPSIDTEAVQQTLDLVRTYYELLNMPFEALIAFIAEHGIMFSAEEYANLLKVQVPGRDIPADAEERVLEILSQ